MVKKHWKLITLMVVAGLALCVGAVTTTQIAEKEERVSIDQVPAAVKATILAEAGTGTIKEIELGNEDGQAIYEADVVIDGQEVEIKVAADGTLLGKEDDDEDNDDGDDEENEDEELVSIDQVPAAVKATILAEAGTGTIKEIEKENENGQIIYEAEVIIDGQETDIKVAENGTLLGMEVDDEDNNEKNDDD